MSRFSALTDLRPEKSSFFDRAKTVYLKAEHHEKPITLYWIEQKGVLGRNSYPCVCDDQDGELLVFLPSDKSTGAALDQFWETMTKEILQAEYTVSNLPHQQFSDEFRAYREKYYTLHPKEDEV